jgi:hypothetical protein
LSAAGEQNQALGVVWKQPRVQLWIAAVLEDVREGEEAAEVGIALGRCRQQGEVGSTLYGHFSACDASHLQGAGGSGELHGATEVIVVREGQRSIAQIFSA